MGEIWGGKNESPKKPKILKTNFLIIIMIIVVVVVEVVNKIIKAEEKKQRVVRRSDMNLQFVPRATATCEFRPNPRNLVVLSLSLSSLSLSLSL